MMKNRIIKYCLSAALGAIVFSAGCSTNNSMRIKTVVPERPAGQSDVIGLALPPVDTVKVGIVGLGMRGSFAVYRYLNMPWAQITSLCDVETERVDSSLNYLAANDYPVIPEAYTGEEGYKALCEREDLDLVYICTDWSNHAPIALYALEHGKNVAIEVPSATSLEECWALVDASEKNRRHCVILENCCYDFFELTSLEMARQGVLGEILHAEGSYHHNLTDYWHEYWKGWRLEFNRTHKGDIYPTHGLGPVCQALGINRGDKLNTLVAVETKSVNGKASAMKYMDNEDIDFQNGDQTCTVLTTEKGKTILIEHNVMTPRPYDRMYQLVGTRGYVSKYPVEQFYMNAETVEGIGLDHSGVRPHEALPADLAESLKAKYRNPILSEELEDKAKTVGGHGGMDFLMDYRLIYCLHYGLPVDMDVYDLASWCCISELGARSIDAGNVPVEVPDFTRGAWEKRQGLKYAFSDGSIR